MRPLLTLFFLLCCLLPGCAAAGRTAPRAVHGILDATSWDFEKDGELELRGDWEFHWGVFLAPGSLPSQQPACIGVPGSWVGHSWNGTTLPRNGFATFRVRVLGVPQKMLSLYFMGIDTASRILVNGVEVARNGEPATTRAQEKTWDTPVIVHIPAGGPEMEIVAQVSNFHGFAGGIPKRVYLGPRSRIGAMQHRNLAFDTFLWGCLFVIALYHFAMYFFRRQERASFWFGLFALLYSIRAIFINERFFLELFPGLPWGVFYRMEYLTVSLAAPLIAIFLETLFPHEAMKNATRGFSFFGFFYSVLILAIPTWFFSPLLVYFHVVLLVEAVYVWYVLISAALHKRTGALFSVTGFVALFLTALNDIMVTNDLLHTPFLASFGFLAFFTTQSLNISYQFSRDYQKVEKFSETLERRVKERTRELQKERNLLKERSELMDKEIELARRIQRQLIPLSQPMSNIYTLYKPMDMLGGDFFEFVKFRDPRQVGIFISDVSGHGVPAAFVTSMIKTVILQAGQIREDPAGLLLYLNEALYDKTGGNFITALYMIYYPETRTVKFANAGHPAPMVITEKGIAELKGIRGRPLAIMDNDGLQATGKSPVNNTAVMKAKSKVFLYTDGLIEATKSDDVTKNFGDCRLMDTLDKIRSLPSSAMVNLIYKELIDFRGKGTFEDDVCMISVDL